MTRRRRQPESKQVPDYLFEFKYCNFDVTFEEGQYTEKEQKEIKDLVFEIGNHIFIDKSYVDFKGSKYEKTFMREQGWNELCALLQKTKLGKYATKVENSTLMICYTMMIQCYVYIFLDDLGIDVNNLCVELAENTGFLTHVEEDTSKAWEKYPGKWQTWDNNVWNKLEE